MPRLRRARASALAGSALLVLGACIGNTPPTRFYVLSALEPGGPAGSGAPGFAASVGVGPVQLPKYVDRPQIVVRRSANAVHLAEFEHWAEPLAGSVARVVAQNLIALLGTDRVLTFPWDRGSVDYQVALQVTRFDLSDAGPCELVARWSLLGRDSREPRFSRISRYRETAAAPGYESAAAAMSLALEQLSREIAEALVQQARR